LRGTSRASAQCKKHNTMRYVEDRNRSGKEKHHDDDKRSVDQWFAVRLFAWRPGPGMGKSTEK